MKKLFTLSIAFLMLALLVWPKLSYADWGWGQHPGHHGTHQYYRYHDHLHFGIRATVFYPGEYFSIWAGGRRYYYDDGIYYNYVGGDYVTVAPPIGAVVSTIPSDFQPVVINGQAYYTDNGSYYVHTPNGYQVVSQPAQAASPETVVNTPTIVKVNVPSFNGGGGYVTVTLRRSGNGFVGPQGEFYAAFPKVSQLQTMYGR